MLNIESVKMTALWPNNRQTLTFYVTFLNSIPNWAIFGKEVFNSMFSLGSVKITALWLNDKMTAM